MNIKILDSWLREYLKTDATARKIAEILSLTSVSVERLEKYGNDYLYDIEITTNRPDLASVIGLAHEAAAALTQFGIKAKYIPIKQQEAKSPLKKAGITIKNNPKLVNRICAAILEVSQKQSPDYIKKRLEASGIRSLNNIIDVTNYVMRETGHPAHVFDYDRIKDYQIIIRESKKGEKITTLDGKSHTLKGGDIVADNGKDEIIDLLGVMGTANSVVTESTKNILFFIDNNNPSHIRKTSMSLAIRTEAAILNEKDIDPELAKKALLSGINLFQKVAGGKLISDIIDIYPNRQKPAKITISENKINQILGVTVSLAKSKEILESLGFETKTENHKITAYVHSTRAKDVETEEDIIEEIARLYGYHRLPSQIPPLTDHQITYNLSTDEFFWIKRVKNALKYWGFTEIYTYSFVSEEIFEGPVSSAIEIANPLTEDFLYLRSTLVPSLLQTVTDNPNRQDLKIFELANIYQRKEKDLPDEILTLAGIVKETKVSFLKIKGIIQQLLFDLGIKNLSFKKRAGGGEGADIFIEKNFLGSIEVLDENIIDFELNFQELLKYANLKKTYEAIPAFPPVIEDVRIWTDPKITYEDIVGLIKKQSGKVAKAFLLDVYQDKKTFRIMYQDTTKNLTNEEVAVERNKIYSALEKELGAKIV